MPIEHHDAQRQRSHERVKPIAASLALARSRTIIDTFGSALHAQRSQRKSCRHADNERAEGNDFGLNDYSLNM
jgi:hypothetical protein